MSWYKAQYARQILIISVGKLMTQLQEIIQYIVQVKSVPFKLLWIECFHSRGQHLCKFIAAKESVCVRREYNSHRTGLGHQHGRRDVMWKHSIKRMSNLKLIVFSNDFRSKWPNNHSSNVCYLWFFEMNTVFVPVKWKIFKLTLPRRSSSFDFSYLSAYVNKFCKLHLISNLKATELCFLRSP